MKWVKALSLVAIGVAIGIGGVYVGEADDSPGASALSILLMLGLLALAVRTVRRKT